MKEIAVADTPNGPASQSATESIRADAGTDDQHLGDVELLEGAGAGLIELPVGKPLTPSPELVGKPLTPSPERVRKTRPSRGKPRGRPRKNPA